MEFHPVAEIFPMMGPDDFEVFCLDIGVNQQRDPIFVAEGKIADGRNRYNACLKLGVEPKYRYWDGKGDLTAIVVSLNLHRRHLSLSQRAMVAAKLSTLGVGRPQSNTEISGISQTSAAKLLNISTDSVGFAKRVQTDGVPELVEQVESGGISISSAAKIALMPKEQQKRIVKRGRKAARQILVKEQTKSVKKAFRLGCLNCDTSIKGRATSDDLSGQLQRMSRNQPQLAWAMSDVIEEIESEKLTKETQENYDKVLSAIRLGYQTAEQITHSTGIDRQHLDHAIANMLDYNMIRAAKETTKTDKARGATKTIYHEVHKAEWNTELYSEREGPDDELTGLTYELDDEEPEVYLGNIWDD